MTTQGLVGLNVGDPKSWRKSRARWPNPYERKTRPVHLFGPPRRRHKKGCRCLSVLVLTLLAVAMVVELWAI